MKKKEQEKQYGWGGARPNSGRRKSTGKDNVSYITLNMRVREATVNALREAAEREEISLSKKANEVLTEWANRQSNTQSQPPLDTAAQFLVAILRRAVEMMDEERREKEEN